MKLIANLLAFFRPSDSDALLDHVLVTPTAAIDWRIAAIERAREKYGRSFKAGPKGMGEVLQLQSDGKLEVAASPVIVLPDNVARLQIGGAK